MPRCHYCGSPYFETMIQKTSEESFLKCKGCGKTYKFSGGILAEMSRIQITNYLTTQRGGVAV